MKLSEVKDLVKNQGYAIHNDDTVEKLNEVLTLIFDCNFDVGGSWLFYFKDKIKKDINTMWCEDEFNGNSINLSEIELPNKITLEMVVDLANKHTNDMDLGSELRKLLNNTKRS